MLCFHHHDRPAIGVCKSCGRGLCPDCAADLGHGLACKGVHEEAVKTLHDLVARNLVAVGRNDRYFAAMPVMRWLAPGFFALCGAVFIGFGLHDGVAFGWVLGAVMLVFAVAVALVQRKTYGTPAKG